MLKLRTNILVIILSLVFLHSQSNASIRINWTAGDYNIPNLGWAGADILNTYNNVTVTIPGEDGVSGEFNMYDNSKLIMYDGYITTLNLYPDATAIVKGGNIHYLWIDPTTDGWVKLYAYNMYVSPFPDSHGYRDIHGYWLADNSFFDIELENGTSTYSHIQIVPEPTTLFLLTLGGLFLRKRKA